MSIRSLLPLTVVVALIATSLTRSAQADPTAAATPPMGWNSYQNTNYGFYNQDYLKQVADAMVSSGLSTAGYNFVNLDGGWWQESLVNGNYVRYYLNSDDTYRLDPTRFSLATPGDPNSATLSPLADYVHGKGLKLGFYSAPLPDVGQNNPAVVGTGDQAKANQLAAWGVDFLKYDNYDPFPSAAAANAEYANMGQALTHTGHQIVYSIHDGQQLGSKVSGDVNMWRTSSDIGPGYSSVLGNFDNNFSSQVGPHHWGDPDMLQIGDGGRLAIYAPKTSYTRSKNDFAQIYSKTLPDEEKSAMSLWSMSAAPLLIAGDVRNLSAYDKYVLENTEVIAIDQDANGLQAKKVGAGGSVYYKPLSDGSIAVMLLNRSPTAAASLHVNWADIGVTQATAQVRDLWAHQDLGGFANGYTTTVPPNGVGPPPRSPRAS